MAAETALQGFNLSTQNPCGKTAQHSDSKSIKDHKWDQNATD